MCMGVCIMVCVVCGEGSELGGVRVWESRGVLEYVWGWCLMKRGRKLRP